MTKKSFMRNLMVSKEYYVEFKIKFFLENHNLCYKFFFFFKIIKYRCLIIVGKNVYGEQKNKNFPLNINKKISLRIIFN